MMGEIFLQPFAIRSPGTPWEDMVEGEPSPLSPEEMQLWCDESSYADKIEMFLGPTSPNDVTPMAMPHPGTPTTEKTISLRSCGTEIQVTMSDPYDNPTNPTL